MKKISAIQLMIFCFFAIHALGQGIGKRAKENAQIKAENRVNQKVDKAIDDVLDGNVFKRKPKPSIESKINADSTETSMSENKSTGNTPVSGSQEPTSFKSYSKFDFIPGDKVIAFEDFSQDAVGDFPAQWNTNGSGEVVTTTLGPGKWLKFLGEGIFYPEFLDVLDENMTIEFEIGTSPTGHVQTNIHFVDAKINSNLLNYDYPNVVNLSIDPLGSTNISNRNGNNEDVLYNKKEQKDWLVEGKPVARVSLWRQKNRLRVYINETKVWDIPRAFQPNVPYRMVMSTTTHFVEDREVYLANFKAAIGAPDTRNKLIAEGKFSTTGILFDFQKATIKPESYAVLKDIAAALNENPGVKFKIVGHTSNDGDANANLTLSKQRAASVKAALVREFGIAENRLETDGVGGSQPADNTSTPAGKANNRRVEFIKL